MPCHAMPCHAMPCHARDRERTGSDRREGGAPRSTGTDRDIRSNAVASSSRPRPRRAPSSTPATSTNSTSTASSTTTSGRPPSSGSSAAQLEASGPRPPGGSVTSASEVRSPTGGTWAPPGATDRPEDGSVMDRRPAFVFGDPSIGRPRTCTALFSMRTVPASRLISERRSPVASPIRNVAQRHDQHHRSVAGLHRRRQLFQFSRREEARLCADDAW